MTTRPLPRRSRRCLVCQRLNAADVEMVRVARTRAYRDGERMICWLCFACWHAIEYALDELRKCGVPA